MLLEAGEGARGPSEEVEPRRLSRFVLKLMISTSNPFPSAAGVMSNLSIAPLRIPSGRRRRNSIHSKDLLHPEAHVPTPARTKPSVRVRFAQIHRWLNSFSRAVTVQRSPHRH